VRRTIADHLLCCALAVCALAGFSPRAASAAPIAISTVPVGNLGNANDSTGYGAVAYDYRIGATEVTNAQYAAFLNAKAQSDPLGLYNAGMSSNALGGITQSGVSGGFTYTTRENMGDKPVNFVSWYDAIRFANWLNNGQGAGDTETGAYTILGGTPTPSNASSITRNVDADWFLASENEWYKAAYHQPGEQGGDADNYWRFATQTNTAPTVATADSTGNISNPGANVANYNNGADWNAQDGNFTTVASAGALSASFYGTYDQAGNASEWNEALIAGSNRGIRGGTFANVFNNLQATVRGNTNPTTEAPGIGFRVATFTAVPEPGTGMLAIVGCALLLWWGKKRK
jgi:sulfatase modifying factor 1